jgi:hypothetical protein
VAEYNEVELKTTAQLLKVERAALEEEKKKLSEERRVFDAR